MLQRWPDIIPRGLGSPSVYPIVMFLDSEDSGLPVRKALHQTVGLPGNGDEYTHRGSCDLTDLGAGGAGALPGSGLGELCGDNQR